MSVGECSCNSQQHVKVVNVHLQLFYTARLGHRPTAETKSPVNRRETQPSFEPDNDVS